MNNQNQNPQSHDPEFHPADAQALAANGEGHANSNRELGEAISKAVGQNVHHSVNPPPVARIAEGAKARARARTARRTVVGVAASFALAVGGVAVWNATSEDSPTEELVVAASPTSSTELTQAASSVPSPAEVSTGPTLSWTAINPATFFGTDSQQTNAYSIIGSVGDGKVLVRADTNSGAEYLLSANGSDWEKINVPTGFYFDDTWDLAGSRWLLAGPATDPFSDTNAAKAFYSDNAGNSWNELQLNIGTPTERVSVIDAIVSGQNMVVSASIAKDLDLAELIVARGLAPDKEAIQGPISLQGNTLSYALSADALTTFGNADSSEGLPSDDSYESFVLTPEEQEAIDSGRQRTVRLFWSNGGQFQQVAEYAGRTAEGYGTASGFELLVLGQSEHLKLSSANGQTWKIEQLIDSGTIPAWDLNTQYSLHNGGTVWTSGNTAGDYRVKRFSGAFAPPLTAEIPEGVTSIASFSVGPKGIAVLADPYDVNAMLQETELTQFRVEKNGYELRYMEPVGGLSLWDAATDELLFLLERLPTGTNQVPASTEQLDIRIRNDQSNDIVFENPATKEVLVTFTDADLDAAVDSAYASLENTAKELGAELNSEQWLGWSKDGNSWGWQTVSKAFALSTTSEDTDVNIAVGNDFAIATLTSYSDVQQDTDFTSTRWFLAPLS